MKLFSRVAVVTDHTMLQEAYAIRAVLEAFRIRVEFIRFVQKPHILEFFSRGDPPSYTVIVCHGTGEPPDDLHLALEVGEQKDQRYEETEGWSLETVKMTPTYIRHNIRGRRGTLISYACGSGRQPLAEAFINAGYSSYIAPLETYYDSQAGIAFITSFFYLLLSEDRDYVKRTYSEEEAVRLAAALDSDFKYGPQVFRRFTKAGYDSDVGFDFQT